MTKPSKTRSSDVSFANKVVPQHTWTDLMLPSDKKEQLRAVCNCMNHAEVLKTQSRGKPSSGTGFGILFSGPAGTGKIMAAEVIANELKLDLYAIDLSEVVSKYIGETEKNLDKLFKEVEESNAVLFFDEADALFGKRTEVKDAHDRYADIEINYLLDRIEGHKGLVILATNSSANIEDAFLRRIHFIVSFPFPKQKVRTRNVKKMPEPTKTG